MDVNLSNIELLDIVKEIKADLVIEYYTAKISLKEEDLQMMRDNGLSTNVKSCIQAGFILAGKTLDEIKSFMREARQNKGGLSIEFVAPEGGIIDIKSKEDNPKLDQLIQLIENNG